MATINASGSPSAVSTDTANVSNLLSGTITQATGNTITVRWSGGIIRFGGSFGYNSTGTTLTAGTLTTISEYTSSDTLLYTMSGLSTPAVTFQNWVYSGANSTARTTLLSGSDVLVGSNYADTLRGYAGNDAIYGGAGNDTLDGGSGANWIDGGAGTDYVVRSASSTASTIFSYNGVIVVSDPTYGRDILTNVEQIDFTDRYYSTSSAPGFDALGYIAANPDLAAAFGANTEAAFNHFINSGYAERRTTSFNALSYVAANADLIAAFGTNTQAATAHYIAFGRSEGRSTSFNASSYLGANADLTRAFGSDTQSATLHYIVNGYREGRALSATRSAGLAADDLLATPAGLLAAGG